MTRTKRSLYLLITAVLFSFFALSCTQDSIVSINGPDSVEEPAEFNGKPIKGSNERLTYPQSASYNYSFHKEGYRGGSFTLPNGTVFELMKNAITPPPSTPWGDDVVITMTADLDTVNNELLFEFGPHGCQFSPAAKVYLNYADLGIEIPTLYYIDDNGNYIEQIPDDIDVTNKLIILTIHHFSRYALSRG
ncbi:MAG: hypothetical protein ACRBF0_00940 [Calditrichia bacterium]